MDRHNRAGGRDGFVLGLRPRSAPICARSTAPPRWFAPGQLALEIAKPDSQVLPVLLTRLGDSDPVVRLAAHEELRKRTGQDFGYLPWASPEERSSAIERWRALDVAGLSGQRHHAFFPVGVHSQAEANGTARSKQASRAISDSQEDQSLLEGSRPCRPHQSLAPSHKPLGPVAWVGTSAIAGLGYAGGVTLLLLRVAGSLFWPWPARGEETGPGFIKSLMHQLFWMLYMGIPLVGLVHIAIGSFLSLQAYYGSTFVDGTGAVVGVGLLRNLGGIMSGMIFSGILAARMIPELRMLSHERSLEQQDAADVSTGSRRTRRDASDDDCRRSDFQEPEQAGRSSGRRRGDRRHLAMHVGNHGRDGGRLEGLRVDDGPLDRDVLHDVAQDDVVPRRSGPHCQRHSFRRSAGGDLLLRGLVSWQQLGSKPARMPLYSRGRVRTDWRPP